VESVTISLATGAPLMSVTVAVIVPEDEPSEGIVVGLMETATASGEPDGVFDAHDEAVPPLPRSPQLPLSPPQPASASVSQNTAMVDTMLRMSLS
jgi:hypothetical protein